MSFQEHYTAKPGQFFGVYILYSKNPKHKGDIYIGFTVNPAKRIRQHNREVKGGARKTGKNKGMWDMVLITHGFPNMLSALQFEWAWQHPGISKRLSHLTKKSSKETKFTYRLRILSEMLNTGPWNRLPLTIQWLKQEYNQEFPINRPPPNHMPIAYGPIITMKRTAKEIKKIGNTDNTNSQDQNWDKDGCLMNELVCFLCDKDDKERIKLRCIVKACDMVAHMICLAGNFLKQEQSEASRKTKQTKSNSGQTFLIPVSGDCPKCKQRMMWGDVLKQRRYSIDNDDDDGYNYNKNVSEDEESDFPDTQNSQNESEDDLMSATQSE